MRSIFFLCVLGLTSSTFAQDFQTRPQQQQRNAFEIPARGARTTSPALAPATTAPNTAQQDDEGFGVLGKVTDEHAEITTCFAKLIQDIDVPAEETGKLIFLSERDSVGNLVMGENGKPRIKTINRGRFVRALSLIHI